MTGITKGNLRTVVVSKPLEAVKGQYWLSEPDLATIHNAPTSPYWLKKFSSRQMDVMQSLYRERSDFDSVMARVGLWEDENYPDMPSTFNKDDSLDLAEVQWVFHGTPASWDDIHKTGALYSTGESLDIDSHFHSSATHKTAFVSTSRRLDVAVGMASKHKNTHGTDGYVYLIHAESGIKGNPKQAEVSIPGEIHLRQIFMFRWLGDLQRVYVNNDFNRLTITERRIKKGTRLLCAV